MRIKNDVDLPDDAIADIRQVSLLGEKYVALEAPAGRGENRLSDGDNIRWRTPADLEVEECSGPSRSCSAASQLGDHPRANGSWTAAPTGCATILGSSGTSSARSCAEDDIVHADGLDQPPPPPHRYDHPAPSASPVPAVEVLAANTTG